MKKSLFCTLFVFLTALAFADEVKPLYRLPEKNPVNAQEGEAEHEVFLVGSDDGLFRVTNRNSAIPVWTEGRVDQLLRVTLPDASGVTRPAWLMRTQKGIFYSNDLKTFEERDKGLPFLTIKKYSEGTKNLELQIQELKDLCVNPLNNSEVVTATKDSVFFSRDGGLTWQNLSSMSKNSPGVKAVAVATIENQPVVFMAHPIFGLSYILPDKPKPEWQDIDAGFEKMPSLTSPDEIADILPVVRTNADGSNYTEIYISQTYIPRIYRLNWQEKQAELIYTGSEPTDVTEIIYQTAKKLMKESWHGEPLRLIGLSISDIDRDGFEQMTLFVDENKEKRKALDGALDSIRGKFGNASVQRASTMDTSRYVNRKFKAEDEIDRG